MDGNTKEEFCSMCSVEVPSAFANDNEYEKEENKEQFKNDCAKWTKWILNILFYAIIITLLYFLFRKNISNLKK